MTALRVLVVLALAAMTIHASAHETVLPDGRTVDFTHLMSPQGGSCCNGFDCRVADERWLPDGTMEAELDPAGAPGLWRPVPPERIIWVRPEALREVSDLTIICWLGTPATPTVYCAYPKAQAS